MSVWPAFHFLQEVLQTTSAHRQPGWGLGVKPWRPCPGREDRVGCSQGEAIVGGAWNKAEFRGTTVSLEVGRPARVDRASGGAAVPESVGEHHSC